MGTLTVVVIPGLLVAMILGLRARELLTWAAIPAFSVAAVFLLGEATTLVGAPFGWPAFVLLLVVLGGVLGVVRSRRSARSRIPKDAELDDGRTPIEPRLWERAEYGLLALGVAVGGLTWFRGLRGVPLIPPGGDATRHGWFVARILHGQTLDISQVLSYDVSGAHSSTVSYYPLALHASAALSTRLAGSDVGRVLVAYVVVFSAIVLPVGMFVLARTLVPDRPLVAGFTALVVPLMMLFPYHPVSGGDLPLMVAMALVPVVVVLLRRAMLAVQPRIGLNRAFLVALAPAGLAIFCIIAVHLSELPLIVFLALLLVLERAWRTRDVRMLSAAVVRGLAVGVFAIVLLAPTVVSLGHGVSERVSVNLFVAENPANWESSLGAMLQLHWAAGAGTLPTVRQGFLSLLAVVGAALCLMWRRPAWVTGWLGVVLLTLFASASTNALAHELTTPWYHLDGRIVVNLAYFVPFFVGVTLASGAVVITRMSRRSWVILPASIAMVAVLTPFAGLHGFRANSDYVRASFKPSPSVFNQALIADSTLAAFQWLHDNSAPGDTVANTPQLDGSLWMYAQKNVAPLIGNYYAGLQKVPADFADRLYLVEHLPSLGSDARANDLAHRYHTRWVFFDTHQLLVGQRVVTLDALRKNPNLTPVFHKGGTWVFRVDLADPSGADEPAATTAPPQTTS